VPPPVTDLNIQLVAGSAATRTVDWGVGWQNGSWTGATSTPEEALACADGKYAAVYQFVAGGLERYFPGRPDISNLTDLAQYDLSHPAHSAGDLRCPSLVLRLSEIYSGEGQSPSPTDPHLVRRRRRLLLRPLSPRCAARGCGSCPAVSPQVRNGSRLGPRVLPWETQPYPCALSSWLPSMSATSNSATPGAGMSLPLLTPKHDSAALKLQPEFLDPIDLVTVEIVVAFQRQPEHMLADLPASSPERWAQIRDKQDIDVLHSSGPPHVLALPARSLSGGGVIRCSLRPPTPRRE
jgi:hypothetical protein